MDDPESRFDKTGKPSEPVEIQKGKESFTERIGITGLLGGTAAIITAVAALISAFNHVGNGAASETSHPPAAAAANSTSDFVISDYWSGTPDGTSQPLIFHLLADSKAVLGTMRNPCQSELVVPIESGTWDGNHLIVHVTRVSSHVPLTLDVNRAGDRLEGSVVQVPFDGHITLRRGEVPCPIPPEQKDPAKKQ